MMNSFFRISVLILLPLISWGQDANKIIDGIILRMNKIKDYSVQVKIKSDIPLIKILPVNATIYFKQKDQFKMVSKGIAILPKQGFTDLSRIILQKNTYNALLTGTELVQNIQTNVITILPLSDTSDVILLKIWVDPNNNILKSQMTTRSSGTLTAAYEYGLQAAWGLPDQMTFTMDVKKFKMPKGVTTDIQHSADNTKPVRKTGMIYIQLSSYSINKGIADAIFKN